MDEILGDRSNLKNYLWNNAMDVDFIASNWAEFLEYYRSGKTAEGPYTEEMSLITAGLTNNIYLAFLYMILPQEERLQKILEEGIDYLDVGCGSGTLITQLAQNFGASRFKGIDVDSYGIAAAGKKAAEMGVAERATFEIMSAADMKYENEFDMASMVVSLHEIPVFVREKAINRVYAALKEGGTLLVLDFPFPSSIEDFRNPACDFAVHDQFFEICGGIIHLTTEERDQMLSRAGFGNIRKTAIGKGMFELVIAEKKP
jgi:ubiquinone/menaquinone biosynthesis C-methylase UbiE